MHLAISPPRNATNQRQTAGRDAENAGPVGLRRPFCYLTSVRPATFYFCGGCCCSSCHCYSSVRMSWPKDMHHWAAKTAGTKSGWVTHRHTHIHKTHTEKARRLHGWSPVFYPTPHFPGPAVSTSLRCFFSRLLFRSLLVNSCPVSVLLFALLYPYTV